MLDVSMPGTDGLTFCRQLKADPATAHIGVVLLTGSEGGTELAAQASGADAFLRKPFSPLELLNAVERIAGGLYEGPYRAAAAPPEEQLILYAQDLRRLLEVERGQRSLIQRAYRETVSALTGALESKDMGTGEHSQRVQKYAVELARGLEPSLLDDESVEYGFLLHDIGKIGIPDKILQKKGSLSPSERRLLETHTVLGEQLMSGVALLQGQGLQVVRHHHERWDGAGYPDGVGEAEIPLGARVFAVADALDAMTSDRPYRRAGTLGARRGGDRPRERAPVRPAGRRGLPRSKPAPAPNPLRASRQVAQQRPVRCLAPDSPASDIPEPGLRLSSMRALRPVRADMTGARPGHV